ncbi:MAG: DUF4430 domain-containing protein [Clostridia bacterium]|nr:DUF4430 domain-containing protein [Clostridia bacterium]
MNNTTARKWLSFILCLALIAAIALTAMGCDQAKTPETPETTAAGDETAALTVKGEGATVFYFNVVDKDGSETKFEIHTDKTIVGDALLELGLIAGEEGPYGLYVKTVNGITADYETDGTYWAFYEGDSYGMTGVDLTEIKAGATYAFKVSK